MPVHARWCFENSKRMNIFRQTLIVAFGAFGLLAAATASAQGSSSFPQVAGKSCPSYFTGNGKTCTTKSDDLVGFVGNGNCPSGWTRVNEVYCTQKQRKEGGAGSSSSGGAVYVAPSFGEVAKAQKTARCPSGYMSDGEGEKCTTPSPTAPKTALKKGICPTGTVEEWGAYCTQALSDTSDTALDRLDAAVAADFNRIYVWAQIANMNPLPKSEELPAAFAAAKASRAAAGKPWKPVYERDREAAAANAKTPEQQRAEIDKGHANQEAQIIADMQAKQRALGINPAAGVNPNAASNPQEAVKDAGKEAAKAAVSGVLKGLFGR